MHDISSEHHLIDEKYNVEKIFCYEICLLIFGSDLHSQTPI